MGVVPMASEYYNLLQSVVSALSAIPSIPLNNAGQPNVSARSKPLNLDGVDVLPNVIVWPGPNAERVKQFRFGGADGTSTGVIWEYPVSVVLVTAGNRDVQQGLQTYMDLREAIRDQLLVAVTGFTGIFDDNIEVGDVFELQAFLAGNYDICHFTVNYSSSEYLTS